MSRLLIYLPEQQNIKESSSDDDRVDDYSRSSESENSDSSHYMDGLEMEIITDDFVDT